MCGLYALRVARTLFQQASLNKDKGNRKRLPEKTMFCSTQVRVLTKKNISTHSFPMSLLSPSISTHSEYSSEFHLKMAKEKTLWPQVWEEAVLPKLSWAGRELPTVLSHWAMSYWHTCQLLIHEPTHLYFLYKTINIIYLIAFSLFIFINYLTVILAALPLLHMLKNCQLVNKCFRTVVHLFLIKTK